MEERGHPLKAGHSETGLSMAIHRRAALKLMTAATLAGALQRPARSADATAIYDLEKFGNARILHMTDTHAQLLPVYFREPSVNIGIGAMRGQPPHLVGQAFLDRFEIKAGSAAAHAFTFLDFEKSARERGKLGGFAQLKTLIDRLRGEVAADASLLVDGGDLWQGSGLSQEMKGADMVAAANILGIEMMTGHWEFSYGEKVLRDNLAAFKGEFLAQNVFLNEEAAFNDAPAFDTATGRVFKPFSIKEMGGYRVAVIGQAFPYVPVAHPKRFVPDWTFGVREQELQQIVERLRNEEKVDSVILLSHNGMDVDLKLAGRVAGIDVILGGHTHDATPQPVSVENAGGKTLVTNGGSSGKFLGVLDLELGKGKVKDARYRLLPVFADLLKPNDEILKLIGELRKPYIDQFTAPLAVADRTLYRRGNFNGTMDQLICAALRQQLDAEIALSPGFRWGASILSGETITTEDLLTETAMNYPEVYVQPMTGEQIKAIMEDVCDNLFNSDPYYQQGGDMVRIGGMTYTCAPNAGFGSRISNLKSSDGRVIDAGNTYRVAGWASVNEQQGEAVSAVVTNFLKSGKASEVGHDMGVTLHGVEGNPGIGTAA